MKACIKYSLFLFNFVFVVAGLVVIVLGIILHTNGTFKFVNNSVLAFSVIVIIIGATVFLLAFFGCCGAMRDSSWKLTLYGVLVIILFLIEVAAIGIALGFKEKTDEFMKVNMKKSIQDKEMGDALMWDKIQAGFHCCGVDGPNDYSDAKMSIPPSCCGTDSNKANSSCSEANAHQTGCFQRIKDFIQNNDVVVISTAGVVAICQILASASAFWLANKIKQQSAGFSAYGAQPPQGPPTPAPPARM